MVSTTPFARIALAIPVPELFDYRVPENLDAEVVPGARVRVPFGRGSRVGYCIERAEESRHPEPKLITAVMDEEPVLDAHLLELIRWTADYYLAPVGEVVEAAVPSGVRRERKVTVRWAKLVPESDGDSPPDTRPGHEARARILSALRTEKGPLPLRTLLQRADASESSVKTLEKRQQLEMFSAPPPEESFLSQSKSGLDGALALTPAQQAAVDAVAAAASRFEAFLLAGVTGSGKTEVYLQCIQRTLHEKKGALVLIPEIALTPQTVSRFRERFGDVAVLHSMLPPQQRATQYRRLRRGEVRVAVGARSAIFAPIPDLGLIVIDECHETSYKQESTPRYHARDVAVMRASMLGIPVVLGSATPTLESLENVSRGRFSELALPERVTAQQLPTIEVVDRREEKPLAHGGIGLLSQRLVSLMKETLSRGEQALLFLNRRGFARHTHCPTCGFTLNCRECDIALTYHKRQDRALCHYCGAIHTVPETCPQCQRQSLRRRTAGTERIEEVLAKLFPDVAVGRLDRDTAQNREQMEAILEQFRTGRTKILVGTQMVAKGHDIPGVTLVGVIDADVALSFPDFRAAERTAQLICQVAGRAGRGDRPGHVIIQTRQPDHYAIESGRRQDPHYLLEHERASRRLLGYPPFGYLIRVVCEDPNESRALETAQAMGESLRRNASDVSILGPAPAPLGRLRSYFRFHLLIKSRERAPLHASAFPLLRERRPWSTTRVTIDVDPQSLL